MFEKLTITNFSIINSNRF